MGGNKKTGEGKFITQAGKKKKKILYNHITETHNTVPSAHFVRSG